jgi:hypothetical protein
LMCCNHNHYYRPKKGCVSRLHADTGKCCVELTVYEDIAMQVQNSFVQRETLATVEGCCICGLQGKLEAVDGPTCMWKGELEADSRDTLNISKLISPVVDDANFNIAAVQVLRNKAGILDESLLKRRMHLFTNA